MLEAEASSCARGACLLFTSVALFQALLSVSPAHSGRFHTGKLGLVGQRLTSQTLPCIIGGDFQVEPKQLEDNCWAASWWHRSSPPSAVASRRRFLRRLSRPCRPKPQHRSLTTLHSTVQSRSSSPRHSFRQERLVMHRPKSWTLVRPFWCKRPQRHLVWDEVLLDVQEAVARAGLSAFIDAVRRSSWAHSCWRQAMQKLFVVGPTARSWSGRLAKAPGATCFRVEVEHSSSNAQRGFPASTFTCAFTVGSDGGGKAFLWYVAGMTPNLCDLRVLRSCSELAALLECDLSAIGDMFVLRSVSVSVVL